MTATSVISGDDLLDGLTDAQREAVRQVDGAVLVLAGPGSGKTTVVTRRVAYLVAQGIPAWQILALTFTNKAGGEMRDRIDALLHDQLGQQRGLTVATFHSFCARLLRRYAEQVELPATYSIYDAADQRDAIKQALAAADMSSRNWTPAAVGAAISNAKNRLLDAAAFATDAGDFYARSIAKAYTAYEKILRSNDALDFDDLLLRVAKMLRDDATVRGELQDRYQYVLIDEYQDTNHAQFVIAHALAANHGNICVVGDPDQSIYGWRGADIRNILEFEEHYPEARVVPLGQNFRSTGHIVAAADTLIQHNTRRKKKDLYTELEDGERPRAVTCRDEHHEAQFIVSECRRRHADRAIAWKDMAVLCRINALTRVLEEAFRSAQVPYVIARGTAFYERKEVKDALAYLRFVANPHDDIALRRIVNVPTRGIGKTTLNRIDLFAINNQLALFDAMRRAAEIDGLSNRAASAIGKFVAMVDGWRRLLGPDTPRESREDFMGRAVDVALADLVEQVVRESGLEGAYRQSRTEEDQQRLANLGELISAAADFVPQIGVDDVGPARVNEDGEVIDAATLPVLSIDGQLSAFLESVALVSDADAIDPAKGAVTLMTLHAAKGLEFDVVAIAGLEAGLLPHSRASQSEAELEEERRLCFVGMTRAKRHLLMTRAAIRTLRGIRERTIPSTFLGELPGDGVEQGHLDGETAAAEGYDEFLDDGPHLDDLEAGTATDLYPIGCLVRHPKFGLGRVEMVTPRAAGSSARVVFTTAGTKTLILEYAKLQRVMD